MVREAETQQHWACHPSISTVLWPSARKSRTKRRLAVQVHQSTWSAASAPAASDRSAVTIASKRREQQTRGQCELFLRGRPRPASLLRLSERPRMATIVVRASSAGCRSAEGATLKAGRRGSHNRQRSIAVHPPRSRVGLDSPFACSASAAPHRSHSGLTKLGHLGYRFEEPRGIAVAVLIRSSLIRFMTGPARVTGPFLYVVENFLRART
jgi:hypothetical protein